MFKEITQENNQEKQGRLRLCSKVKKHINL